MVEEKVEGVKCASQLRNWTYLVQFKSKVLYRSAIIFIGGQIDTNGMVRLEENYKCFSPWKIFFFCVERRTFATQF